MTEWKDGLHVDIEFSEVSWKIRIQILLTGRISTSSSTSTENLIGKTKEGELGNFIHSYWPEWFPRKKLPVVCMEPDPDLEKTREVVES